MDRGMQLDRLAGEWKQILEGALASVSPARTLEAHHAIPDLIVCLDRMKRFESSATQNKALVARAEHFLDNLTLNADISSCLSERTSQISADLSVRIRDFEVGLERDNPTRLESLASKILFDRDAMDCIHRWIRLADRSMSDTGTQNSTVESDDDLKRLLPDMDEVVGDLRDVMRRGKRSPKIWMERAGCLSSGRLSAFADGRSNDPVSDRMHVLNCRYCRQSLKDLDLPGLDARHIGEALSHPGFDGLVAFLGGTLSEKDRRNVDGHLQACGECREALAAMKTAESDSSIRILRNPSKVKNSGRMGAHDETPSQTGIAYSRLAPVRYAAHSASEGERHLPRETIPAGDLLFEDSDSSAHLFRKAGKITVSIIAPPEISIEVDGVASDGVPLKIARRKRVNETCFSFSREHAKFPVSLTLSIGTRQEIIIIRD